MLIFDLHYIAWRSHFANPSISCGEELTGAIHGVLQQILLLATKFKDIQVIFACDSIHNRRKKIYPLYKKRDVIIEEQDQWLYDQGTTQIQKLKKEILPWLGFKNIFEFYGYEADDVIAAYLMNADLKKKPLVITNDADLFQLLEWCNLYSPAKDEMTTKKTFQKKYGILPHQWVRIKQLAGCASDKVPGIPGIGEKRALSYIKHELKNTTKAYKNIIAFRKEGKILPRNLKLVKLPFPNCPILKIKQDYCTLSSLSEVCKKYNFKKLWEIYHQRWEMLFVK